MLETVKSFGIPRIVGLFLLGMIPSYIFLTFRFSYTLPTLPCGTKGHQLMLMAASGSGLTTTVRFSLSETNLKALYIPYSTHRNETPWEAMGNLLSIYRPVWGTCGGQVFEWVYARFCCSSWIWPTSSGVFQARIPSMFRKP
jgi:hypothetical protein